MRTLNGKTITIGISATELISDMESNIARHTEITVNKVYLTYHGK